MSGWWLAAFLVLWMSVFALGVLVLSLMRQLGLIYLRLDNRVMTPGEGPPLGARIEPFSETDLSTGARFEVPRPGFLGTLLILVSPKCEACSDVIAAAARLHYDSELSIVILSDGDAATQFSSANDLEPDLVYAVNSARISELGVDLLPFGLVIDPLGTIRAKQPLGAERDLIQLTNAMSLEFPKSFDLQVTRGA